MKNLRLHNVSIHGFFFYQNRFINEYARKKKAKISSPGVFFCEIKKKFRF